MLYRYTEQYPVYYPAIVLDGHVLEPKPGDVVDFGETEPPADGRWTPELDEKPALKSAKPARES